MNILLQDFYRFYDASEGTMARRILRALATPGLQAVCVFRFSHWVHNQTFFLKVFLKPVCLILEKVTQIMWGIEIGRSAQIGPGLYICHFGGITISDDAVIGRNADISQQVTIGISGVGQNRGVPEIGDNVYIAPGAKLFGKIYVGNNVKVGANAVIHKDIADNSIVALDPGFKVVSYKGNRTFKNYFDTVA